MKAVTRAILLLAFLAAGCGAPDSASNTDATWVGTITTEGNVTTVINESGSVWGGTATLVEEASIGVSSGADEYMLGDIGGLYATDDEIYLLDQSLSKIRVYDADGKHLRSFGREGQGPGELGRSAFRLAVGDDGRIYVGDQSNQRINIYTADGEPAGEIPLSPRPALGIAPPLVQADNGGIWARVRIPVEGGSAARDGVQVHTAEGLAGEPLLVPEIEYERLLIRVQGRSRGSVPFAPRFIWTFGYDQAVIAGVSDRYAFQVIRPSGETMLVERFWEPVPVTAEEAAYWQRWTAAGVRATESDWNGENIPDHKPAFSEFMSSTSGEIWLRREAGGGLGICDLEPEEAAAATVFGKELIDCLFPNHFFDVFDSDGRFLGRVEGLQINNTPPFFSGNTVVARVEDEAGTIMVKRYRLVLPGER